MIERWPEGPQQKLELFFCKEILQIWNVEPVLAVWGTFCWRQRRVEEDVPSHRCCQQNRAPGRFSDCIVQAHEVCEGQQEYQDERASAMLSVKGNVSLEQFMQEAFIGNFAWPLVRNQ